MKSLYRSSTIVLLLLGIGHTLMTPVFYPEFTEEFLWFAGTGLGLLYLALLNIAALMLTAAELLFVT